MDLGMGHVLNSKPASILPVSKLIQVGAPKGGGGILREILSSQIRTKSGGACSIGTRKGVSGSGSPRDRNGVENGGRKDATFLRPPW